ncbi:MAG: glucosaminidase domain-containing protein [Lewinellaceae bacterium]|nr:glucosaminidase domain-containing protein [Lewinellaceae bacterium]
MNWSFIKTNWFTIALLLLLIAAIVKSNLNFLGSKNSAASLMLSGQSWASPNKETAFGLAGEQSRQIASGPDISQASASAFFKRFSSVAITERKKFGIPASVLLSLAFLNSHAGQDPSAKLVNNYFATPCTEDWEGEAASVDNRCIRKYETAWYSWRDFSIYVSSQVWFGAIKQKAGKDWERWCKLLNGKDISSVGNLGSKMAEVISYYKLYELDK